MAHLQRATHHRDAHLQQRSIQILRQLALRIGDQALGEARGDLGRQRQEAVFRLLAAKQLDLELRDEGHLVHMDQRQAVRRVEYTLPGGGVLFLG